MDRFASMRTRISILLGAAVTSAIAWAALQTHQPLPAETTAAAAGTTAASAIAPAAANSSSVASTVGTDSFSNFEAPHVHPLELTPDGRRLLVVNTANNTLEIYATDQPAPRLTAVVPVGMDPVSVRAYSDHQAWVVNRTSDSLSVVDLQ